MRHLYCHPEARNLPGRDFGCAFTDRVSELSLRTARPIAWHTHDETEIVCCIKGALTYEFDKRLSVTLMSGCFLVIPRGLRHRLADGVDGPCRRISFFLRDCPVGSCETSVFTTAEYREVLSLLLKKRLRAQTFSLAAAKNLTNIADLVVSKQLTLLDKVKIRTFLASAIIEFATRRPSEISKPQLRLIEEAVKWIETHYAEKITLGQLTTFMGYGKTRFIALFKQRTGLPPLEWLKRLRIEKACELLKDSERTVAEIAHLVGFSDPAFFARTFRKHVGISPTELRQKRVPPSL